jgi:hypothetical protein
MMCICGWIAGLQGFKEFLNAEGAKVAQRTQKIGRKRIQKRENEENLINSIQ